MKIDRALAAIVGLVSPKAACSYLLSRQKLRRYLGASTNGPNAAWRPRNQSARALIAKDGPMLAARARDLARNNPHVAGAVQTIVDQVISNGIRPQLTFKKRSGEAYSTRNQKIEDVWKTWSADNNFVQVQQLILRHWIIDGECLVLTWIDPQRARNGQHPMRLRVIEPEQLDTSLDDPGIEFDKNGDPVAYHIFDKHPDDTWEQSKSQRIPADRIIHIFRKERASQIRGVSLLASIIESAHDLDEYQFNERVAARLASAFGIFVKSPVDMSGYSFAGQHIDDAGQARDLQLSDYIESGRIQYLPPGMEIQVADSNRPGSTYEPYVKSGLKQLSVGVGLKYGTFSHDYTDSSYSAERSAALDERRRWEGMQRFLIDVFLNPLWRKWESAAFAGNLIGWQQCPLEWQTPGWPWVDPYKDARAAEIELALGLTTRAELCAKHGRDVNEVLHQLAREKKQMEDLGLLTEEEVANATKTIDDPDTDSESGDL